MYDSIKADISNVCLSNNHSCGSFYDHTVYPINVVNAIRSLCAGKSDGVDDICSDNLKHATIPRIFQHFHHSFHSTPYPLSTQDINLHLLNTRQDNC